MDNIQRIKDKTKQESKENDIIEKAKITITKITISFLPEYKGNKKIIILP